MHRQQQMSMMTTSMRPPPVILSENKRNVIPHGRPLTPIGTVRSASPFFVPRPPKGLFAEEKHGDNLSVRSSAITAPSTTLVEYQKSAHENLVTINNNLSLMLKESFAGIDNICKKVRLCLLDVNPTTINPEQVVVPKPEQLKPAIPTRKTETIQELSVCEEVVSSQDDIPDTADDQVDEIIEEHVEEREENKENIEVKVEKDDKEAPDKPKRTPSVITPFFTILNPTTQSVESVTVEMSSKLKIARKCTVENFHKTMKEVEKLTDYEQFLNTMVDGINKEIDKCYFEYPKAEEGEERGKMNGDKSKEKNKEGKSRKEERPRHVMNVELKKYQEVRKMQRELMDEQFSENDISPKSLRAKKKDIALYSGQMDLYPDVYRKKAITDLHRRLEAQLEANDSLIFFQKLMSNYKKHIGAGRPATEGHDPTGDTVKSPVAYLLNSRHGGDSRKQRSLTNLTKKYQDSLWFRQKRYELKRKRKESVSQRKKRGRQEEKKKEEKILPKSYTLQSSLEVEKNVQKATSQASECKCNIQITNEQPLSESQKCRLHWMRVKYSQMSQKKLQHIDILDEVTTKDLLPIKSEYPRRDEIGSPRAKDSYLYKLLNEPKLTEHAWEQLFRPNVQCSRQGCETCNSRASISKKEEPRSVINDDNFIKKKDPPPPPSLPPRPATSPEPTSTDKRDVVRTLSKYIFLDDAIPKQTSQVFTVMPVHMFYDNARSHSTNRRQADIQHRLPLVPMKETTNFTRKGEWTDTPKKIKPMRVYDPVLKKIENEIRTTSAKREQKSKKTRLCETSSWSPKNFASYQASPQRNAKDPRAICVKIEAIDKTVQKLKKPAAPASAVVRTPMTEIFKRSPKPSAERITPPSLPPWIAVTLDYRLQHKDSEMKQKIQRTISNETQLKAKSNEQQRKIWENKYGKSVGQKLVNFVEKQPAAYQPDMPKHALPKIKGRNPARQHMVLEQLRSLKEKNDHIQDNIQRAIEVIEKKMVEILSKPINTHSIEAFDQMEKEITNVLTMLKTPHGLNKGNSVQEKSATVEEIGNTSEDLFKRLDKILESPVTTNSTKSSKNSLKKGERPTRQGKLNFFTPPRTSIDMNQVCFSSTSASGEEKYTITAISPKRNPKGGPLHTPFVAISSTEPQEAAAISEDVATITNELRKLEHELHLDTATAKAPADDKNRQDPVKLPAGDVVEANKPTREAATRMTPVSKVRNIVPVQEQVVNLALVKQKGAKKSPPSGDQLSASAPKKTIEKSSDEDKNTMGITNSQGDCAARLEDVSLSVYLDSDSFGLDRGTLTSDGKNREFSSFLASSTPTEDLKTTQEEITTTKTHPTTPSSTPTTPNKDAIKQKASQLSLTGPYYTPVTSPLNKTRLGDEETRAITPIAEEEKVPASVTEDGGEEGNKRLGSTQTIDSDEHACQTDDRDTCQTTEERDTCQIDASSGSCKDSAGMEGKGRGGLLKEEKSTSNADGKKEDFYENVNRIITRVENVYNQLEEFEEEMLGDPNKPNFTPSPETATKVAVFKEVRPPSPAEIPVDAFLTPFMHAVKDLRRSCSEKTADSPRSTPRRMVRSPSFFNVLSFLDSLADMKHDKPIEVYSTRVCQSCYTIHIPQTFRFATLLHQTLLLSQTSVADVPKKKSSCLKNPSSHSNVASVPSKSRQKVSFLLVKEEKSTQVTPCPFHSMARVLSQQKVSRVSSNETLSSNKRDEQVSAYLDARENKSVDKMSLDDEASYQSTFELSEEISTQRMQAQLAKNPRETVENDGENKKNVVELFRNSNAAEENHAAVRVFTEEKNKEGVNGAVGEPVRIFYDDLKTICGFYNEESILRVQRSLYKNVAVKKRDSLQKFKSRNVDETDKFCAEIVNESIDIFEPPKHIDRFVDSKFLTDLIEKRQQIRMNMRRRRSNRSIADKMEIGEGREGREEKAPEEGEEKKNLIKGLYVFVYLLMFTALNLEYKCVQ